MPSAASSKSRNSSVHPRPQTGSKESKNASSTEWVEPPLEQSKPSYEDHGGGAFGVLEDMLPLGQPPNAKVKARVRGDPSGSRKTAKNPVGGLASDTQDTPETTPALDKPVASLESAALPAQPLIIFDDEKDQDYAPRQSKKKAIAAKPRLSRSSLARTAASSPVATPKTATPAASVTPVPVLRPTPSEEPVSAPAAAPPVTSSTNRVIAPASTQAVKGVQSSSNTPKSASPQVKTTIPNLDAIVDAAVKRSREVHNPTLGLALRQVHQESLEDEDLMTLLKAILSQTATTEQSKQFRGHISRAKRLIRDGQRNGTTLAASALPQKIVQPPELVPRQSIEAVPSKPLPRPRVTIRVNPPKKPSTAIKSIAKEKDSMAARPRSQSVSSTSSLSSLTSFDSNEESTKDGTEYPTGDPMDIDSNNGIHATRVSSSTTPALPPALPPAQGSSQQTALTVAQPPNATSLKRSSVEVEVDEHERALTVKKQKLSERVDREDRSLPSFIRPLHKAPSENPQTENESVVHVLPTIAHGEAGHNFAPASPVTDLSSPPSTARGTPHATTVSIKITNKKARTKQSPVKKSAVNYGGQLNGNGGKESPIGYDDNEESDNHDFCSSCHGSGLLLCCDGCDRSFHFACVDPPLSQDGSELQEPWFCYQCVARREQPQKHQHGLFSSLLANLDKRNPTIFNLPQDIRDHFEGVATAKDGRFIEAVNGKTRSRTGYDELPDNFKVKDSKGQIILCYHCGKSSMGRREIIACDQCNANWHLDCLDPPLANQPGRDNWGKKVRDWLCPLHIDHELRELEVSRLADRQLVRERKVFMRKPRNAKITDTSLNRGFVNNGLIEILNEEEEEDDFYEEEVSGKVYRLPEKGVRLDFIDKINQTRRAPQPIAPIVVQQPPRLNQADFTRLNFLEQKTALSLVQLATEGTNLDLSGDQVQNLLGVLIAEAPAEVVAKMLEGERDAAEKQRTILELLQSLISKKLEALNKDK